MLPPLPRRSGWAYCFAHSPSRISLPRKGCRVGLRIVLFEACSAFTHVAACTLALSPIRDTLTRGFSHFVTSMTAPVASGWSGCRVGLAPTGKRRLFTAHTRMQSIGPEAIRRTSRCASKTVPAMCSACLMTGSCDAVSKHEGTQLENALSCRGNPPTERKPPHAGCSSTTRKTLRRRQDPQARHRRRRDHYLQQSRKRNAMSLDMWEGLGQALVELRDDRMCAW